MKVLVLGASGMLGSAVVTVMSEDAGLDVRATVRRESTKRFFSPEIARKFVTNVDVENLDSVAGAIGQVRPDVVINCVGVVKQLEHASDPLRVLPINSLLPHRLASLCRIAGARLVHISTDCVFAGSKGGYTENDAPDALDLYGRSKLLGEVDYPHAVTLRTSIIGHELDGARSLVNWFLAENGTVKGFTRAVFSGLPTVVLARVIRDHVLPRPDLCGLYHVASTPISKYDLLCLIRTIYGKSINILPDDSLVIDRSLNASRFYEATGYRSPEWEAMIQAMHRHR